MMDRVSTVVLGLDGFGGAERFADYSQWETWQRLHPAKDDVRPEAAKESSVPLLTKRKLSYLEAREYAGIEFRIAEAEQTLREKLAALHDPAVASDGPRLLAISAEVDEAQGVVDLLYTRWAELENKQA
jgi:ATP-binding cassette subfamily F protein uup